MRALLATGPLVTAQPATAQARTAAPMVGFGEQRRDVFTNPLRRSGDTSSRPDVVRRAGGSG